MKAIDLLITKIIENIDFKNMGIFKMITFTILLISIVCGSAFAVHTYRVDQIQYELIQENQKNLDLLLEISIINEFRDFQSYQSFSKQDITYIYKLYTNYTNKGLNGSVRREFKKLLQYIDEKG